LIYFRNGMEIISMSCKKDHEHITFQMKWMSEQLLNCSEDGNNVYLGGLISDVTY
jgi:hypothetical protein